jgi:4-diphosphocytidyl-2-C-methyl-D-erythritol kinase
MNQRVVVDAPAKINLGLEVLGKRDDGFHEIRSILAMISIQDTLEFRMGPLSQGLVNFEPCCPDIDTHDNLIVKAIHEYNRIAGTGSTPDVTVIKRIPVASGLGGASSDCASTLSAMNALNANAVCPEELEAIAATLGSDIPFFLGSPTAMVSGRGTTLRRVPTPPGAVLIVSPDIAIPKKTTTLYSALNSKDFSDGSAVSQQMDRLASPGTIEPSLLANAFSRALSDVSPESAVVEAWMADAGITKSWLSGAGPSRYTLFDTLAECKLAEERLRQTGLNRSRVFSCTFLQSKPSLRT